MLPRQVRPCVSENAAKVRTNDVLNQVGCRLIGLEVGTAQQAKALELLRQLSCCCGSLQL